MRQDPFFSFCDDSVSIEAFLTALRNWPSNKIDGRQETAEIDYSQAISTLGLPGNGFSDLITANTVNTTKLASSSN
jgi:hypothetical protein